MSASPLPSFPATIGNFLQGVFWPTEDTGRWDAMGRTGLGFCVAIALYHLYALSAGGQPRIALVTAIAYVVGGCGIRAYSLGAAFLLAMWDLLGEIGNILGKYPTSFRTIVSTLILFAFVRGTWIASRAEPSLDELLVQPSASPFTMLVDRLSRRLWSFARYPFFLLGGITVLVCLYGTVMAIKAGDLHGVFSVEN